MGKPHSFIFFLLASLISLAASAGIPALVPNTAVLNSTKLVTIKTQLSLHKANAVTQTSLANLVAQADAWLPQGPWSVTNKTITPPGGNIHDYASQAPYFWPSNTSDGCPYIEKDGETNPQSSLYTDHSQRAQMFQASYILSLAWWYTGKESYGRKAGDILRTWFITSATRMNPNLDHAQIIPCQNTGRAIGIIDFSQGYTSVLDAAAILTAGAPGWTAADASAFQQWNKDFLNWLETSSFGKQETAAKNNHGTFALLQSAGIALFTGNRTLAASKVAAVRPRIDTYITANGSQPLELARTRSFHYSVFDLVAYTRLADIGKKVGVDLWRYRGPAGQSIQQAVNFILPATTGAAAWAYPELDFEPWIASDVVDAASIHGNKDAKDAVRNGQVPSPPSGSLWWVRPAAEQLDPSTT